MSSECGINSYRISVSLAYYFSVSEIPPTRYTTLGNLIMRTTSYFILACFLASTLFAQQPASESSSIDVSAGPDRIPLSLRQTLISAEKPGAVAGLSPEIDVQQWQPFDPLTIGVQSVFGVVGGAAGGFVGAGAGYFLSRGSGGGGWDVLEASILGSYVCATMLGAPLGVYLGGETMGGNGTYWGAMGGGAVGSLIGIAALVLDGSEQAGVPIMYAAALISPIVGYHLSAPSAETEGRLSGSPPLTQPVVPVSSRPHDPVTPRPDVQMTVLSVPF